MKKEGIMHQTEQDFQQSERDRRLAKAVEKCGGLGWATLKDVVKTLGISEPAIKGWLKMSGIFDSERVGIGCKSYMVIVLKKKAVPPTRTGFEEWWYNTGSGIGVKPGDDYEEHAKRVAQAAWDASQQTATRTEQSESHVKQAAALCMAHMNEWADRMRANGEPGWSENHKKRMVYWTLDRMLFEAAFGKCEPCEKEKQS
jgi:hypothetical protein